jgi:hypothetical protein
MVGKRPSVEGALWLRHLAPPLSKEALRWRAECQSPCAIRDISLYSWSKTENVDLRGSSLLATGRCGSAAVLYPKVTEAHLPAAVSAAPNRSERYESEPGAGAAVGRQRRVAEPGTADRGRGRRRLTGNRENRIPPAGEVEQPEVPVPNAVIVAYGISAS